MPILSPNNLTFHHVYTETVKVPVGMPVPEAYRVIKRNGRYPAVLTRGSGVTYLERMGARNLSYLGVGVDPAITPPDLTTAVTYPAEGTAVTVGMTLKNANTNNFYRVAIAGTLATGTTLDARIAADITAGTVVEVPKNLILNNLNPSAIIFAPHSLEVQRIIGMCTDGHAVVELATVVSAAAAGVTLDTTLEPDQPLYVVDSQGRVGCPTAPAATSYIIGYSMDASSVTAATAFGAPAGYVRIKLGSI